MCNLTVRQFSIPLQHWIANNIFGLAFSLNGVELLHLNTVTTGCILLGGLFVYDIFWVCTSVSEEILDEKTLLRVMESDSLFTHNYSSKKSFTIPFTVLFSADVIQILNFCQASLLSFFGHYF